MNNEYNQTPSDESTKETDVASAGSTNNTNFGTSSFVSRKGVVIGIIIFLVLLVLGFMSSRSLPGDALYPMKIQVLERLDAAVQFGSKNKASNQIKNMETRLAETRALSEKDEVSEEALTALHERILTHAEILTNLVQQESADFTMEDRLFSLNSFASIAGAMEEIAENDQQLLTFGDQIEDVRREAVNLYKDTADTFTQSGTPDAVLEFIKNSLADVSGRLSNENLSEEAMDDAEEYIYRVSIAVKDKEYAKAIYAVGEASRFIKIDEYTGVIVPLVKEEIKPADEFNASTTPSDLNGTSTMSSTSASTTIPL